MRASRAGVSHSNTASTATPAPNLTNATYSTLATPAAESGALLDIVFAADATAAQMAALLEEIDGEIVAGPSELGRYRVRVRGGAAEDAQLAVLLRALTADSRVRFAGRSLTEVKP